MVGIAIWDGETMGILKEERGEDKYCSRLGREKIFSIRKLVFIESNICRYIKSTRRR